MENKEVTLESPIETALAKENVTAQVIAELKTKYSGLTIKGLDDKAGFDPDTDWQLIYNYLINKNDSRTS